MSSQNKLMQTLIKEIRIAFNDVPFPEHCGWQAAIAMDDWIDNPITLKQITQEKDIHAKWWDIPASELKECYMAQCYLDAKGVDFYLPAYLVSVLKDKNKSRYRALLSWLLPESKYEDYELYLYFLERFSKLNNEKKEVCLKTILYMKEYLIDEFDYDIKEDIESILHHEFWIN